MFEDEKIQAIRAFYETRERWQDIKNFRSIRNFAGSVENIFYGDSITEAWPLQEFFPGVSLLNRGIGGDNVYGLYDRLVPDVIAYKPKRVFMLIGINGIEEDKDRIVNRIERVASLLRPRGIAVYLGSILPLRYPDVWNRFQYQDKIVEINQALQVWVHKKYAAGFLDYHSLLRDQSGQLAAEFAQPDGTHLTFAAYEKMSRYIRPLLRLSAPTASES